MVQFRTTLKKYSHIFFDLDRTLWDFDKNSRETLTELFFRHNLEASIDNPEDFDLWKILAGKYEDRGDLQSAMEVWNSVAEASISEDYKEAICFAVLANECVHGMAAGMPNVTGALRPAILGKICPVKPI